MSDSTGRNTTMNGVLSTLAGTAMVMLAVAPHAAVAQSACGDAVTVSGGDTLSAIASRCEVTVDELIEANDIDDPRRLRTGQTLVVPGPDWDQASGYVVGPGDTLGSIARELRLPASSLLEVNPDVDPRDLPAGLVLRVPSDWANSFDAGDGPIATSGVITSVECPAIRGPDGQLYALAGAVTDYRPGDRVEIEGETADGSFCVPGPTIEIGQIRTAG
ncbi:MAG: LysM peptidoglycan-binding domain-containing protein [Hyphomicrobiales bacterium]